MHTEWRFRLPQSNRLPLWVGYLCLVSLLALSPAPLHAQSPVLKRTGHAPSDRSAIDSTLLHAIRSAPKAEQWPDQDYALLLDTADVTVKADGTIVALYRQTYKLFNARARGLAEVNLPYNASYQRLHVLSARTIQEDGKVLNVASSAIRPVAQFSEDLLYDDAKGMGFSLPGIKSNSIIDYRWEEITRPMFMPGQFWLSWTFAGPSPVECSRLTLHYPTKSPFHVALHNTERDRLSSTSAVRGSITTRVWESAHMKPLLKEPMMPDWDDVALRLEITSLSSWQEIAHWYWKLQKPQTSSSPALKATVAHLTAGKTTPEDRARAIYDWVSRSVRYVGLEFGLSAFKPHRATDVQTNLYGDCKDKATLLIAMLNEVGIKAYPALLRTDTRDFLDQNLPTPNAFDHCIAVAQVSGKEVWLDATAETCAYGDIPDGDRGAQALVVREGIGEQKTIPDFSQEENGQDTALQVDLHPDGSAHLTADVTWRGKTRQEAQRLLTSLSSTGKQQVLKSFASQLSVGATLEKAVCLERKEGVSSLTLHLECTAPHWAKHVGDLLILPAANVFAISSQEALIGEQRIWPIVQGNATSTHVQIVITLPDHAIVEGIPEEIKNTGPLQTFERHFECGADGRTLTIKQSYREVLGTIPPEKYADVKAYNTALESWAGDQIVLRLSHGSGR
ncbi:MAG: Transglutaminase-like enzyme putative cysteine protease [Chthonomonadaceae bacterium]|nr:Transglutaminase-like enzyme putative cysteine protease [Chthonomonadaceae bacterium]